MGADVHLADARRILEAVMNSLHVMVVAPERQISPIQVEVWMLEILLKLNKRKIDDLVRQRPDLKPLVDFGMRSD